MWRASPLSVLYRQLVIGSSANELRICSPSIGAKSRLRFRSLGAIVQPPAQISGTQQRSEAEHVCPCVLHAPASTGAPVPPAPPACPPPVPPWSPPRPLPPPPAPLLPPVPPATPPVPAAPPVPASRAPRPPAPRFRRRRSFLLCRRVDPAVRLTGGARPARRDGEEKQDGRRSVKRRLQRHRRSPPVRLRPSSARSRCPSARFSRSSFSIRCSCCFTTCSSAWIAASATPWASIE